MTTAAVVEIGDGRLVDDPVSVLVRRLPPGRRVRVRAGCTDGAGVPVTSWADYRVGDDGTLDVARSAPLAGTYRGVDPYGLWWSMGAPRPTEFTRSPTAIATSVQVQSGDTVVGRASWRRLWQAPGVTAEPAGADRTGTLFTPAQRAAPAVLVLGGSDGSRPWAEGVAALLASRGLNALALAYFGQPGLPATLARVPLEYIGAAVSWLSRRPGVAGRVAIAGASRGGELALLAGATFPEVTAVVGWAASGVVWAGLGPGGRVGGAAWTHRGVPVPYAIPDELSAEAGKGADPVVLRPTFAAPAARPEAAAVIPVERIHGPLVLISGGDDQLWPAGLLADLVVRRLGAHGQAVRVRHLHYPAAGHLAGRPPGLPAVPPAPPHPADGRRYLLGGTGAADAASGADAWPQVVDFLRQARAQPAATGRCR